MEATLQGRSPSGDRREPPSTWREHWFEHDQLVVLRGTDQHAAVYTDLALTGSVAWAQPFISRCWRYSKSTYGDCFGPDPRLYAILHQGRYPGGHPAYYFDSSHGHRNVIDCGPGPWNASAIDIPSHEIAHVVESANNGRAGSPAFGIWGDSKWAEFYQYDLYIALGLSKEAQALKERFSRASDGFPRPGTFWFRDWFLPLWLEARGPEVMVRFFRLLAAEFPTTDGFRYARGLNWGEYLHFTSAASGRDLTAQAERAFGWRSQWTAELATARREFPDLRYSRR